MEIAGYTVPDKKKNNKFLHSLKQQYDKKGKLTQKQWEALEDNLGIVKDFYYWDKLPDWDKIHRVKSLLTMKEEQPLNLMKDNLDQLVKGGTETFLNAVFVSLCSIGAIIALIVILITK